MERLMNDHDHDHDHDQIQDAEEVILDAEPQLTALERAADRHGVHPQALTDFVMTGELTKIPISHRPSLVFALCEYIGIDPIEQPFMILAEGKPGTAKFREVLYATRRCTSAICRTRRISREIVSSGEVTIAGHSMISVRARATMASTGRYDEATGVVPLKVMSWGEKRGQRVWSDPDPTAAANLPMKAETKAKRRAVLDLVGLGLTDESEIEGIDRAVTYAVGQEPPTDANAEPASEQTLDQRWELAVDAWSRAEVPVGVVLAMVNRASPADVTAADHDKLEAIYKGLRNGHSGAQATVDSARARVDGTEA
jgi:hypothetical protein